MCLGTVDQLKFNPFVIPIGKERKNPLICVKIQISKVFNFPDNDLDKITYRASQHTAPIMSKLPSNADDLMAFAISGFGANDINETLATDKIMARAFLILILSFRKKKAKSATTAGNVLIIRPASNKVVRFVPASIINVNNNDPNSANNTVCNSVVNATLEKTSFQFMTGKIKVESRSRLPARPNLNVISISGGNDCAIILPTPILLPTIIIEAMIQAYDRPLDLVVVILFLRR